MELAICLGSFCVFFCVISYLAVKREDRLNRKAADNDNE